MEVPYIVEEVVIKTIPNKMNITLLACEMSATGTTNWFQIGKEVRQGCVLQPCLFNLYAEYITWNVEQDESQVRISRTSDMQMTPP